MFAISWRAAPVWGLILALSTGPASAQDPRVVTLDDALTYNRRLWTILATSVTSNDNPLPDEVKQNLGSLGAFILKHTFDVMSNPSPERLTTLIQINRNIAMGLRGS